jgi:hypothetical protein
MRRLPNENARPIALRAVFLLAVTTAAYPPFQYGAFHGRLADVVTARPPGVETLSEYPERPCGARVDQGALADRNVRYFSDRG